MTQRVTGLESSMASMAEGIAKRQIMKHFKTLDDPAYRMKNAPAPAPGGSSAFAPDAAALAPMGVFGPAGAPAFAFAPMSASASSNANANTAPAPAPGPAGAPEDSDPNKTLKARLVKTSAEV